MRSRLPKLYPITDVRLSGLTHSEQVARLIGGGATFIQIREKVVPPAQFLWQVMEAINAAHKGNARLIVNDRVDIALAAKADGVHLGQDDLPPKAARNVLGPDAIIGYSTHSLEQFRQALTLPVDYVALGPIFPTSTKVDAEEVLGLDAIRAAAALAGEMPIVAIGGITSTNAKAVLEAGASSVAVISALLAQADEITQRTKLLIDGLAPLSKSSDKQI